MDVFDFGFVIFFYLFSFYFIVKYKLWLKKKRESYIKVNKSGEEV